uniref:SAC domain-containing protein n=1 Tax=Leersia perrieri TaxID=77586 RepID=A0A0D9XLD8_9ORYZ
MLDLIISEKLLMTRHATCRGGILPYLLLVGSSALERTGIFHCRITPTSASGDSTWKEEVVRAQLGVLRTNCLDCLDRTNSAQYAYAITAFGHQLEALGLIEELKISEDDPLFHNVMDLYEEMGDVLSMQYTGSAAQHKMFWDIKGQSCVISSFQEVIRSIQPYMHNTLWDRGKQDALNVLFGHCQPQQGKPLPPLLCGSEASCNDEEHGSGSNTMVQGRHLVLGTQNRTREPKYQKAFYSNFMEDLPPAGSLKKSSVLPLPAAAPTDEHVDE